MDRSNAFWKRLKEITTKEVINEHDREILKFQVSSIKATSLDPKRGGHGKSNKNDQSWRRQHTHYHAWLEKTTSMNFNCRVGAHLDSNGSVWLSIETEAPTTVTTIDDNNNNSFNGGDVYSG